MNWGTLEIWDRLKDFWQVVRTNLREVSHLRVIIKLFRSKMSLHSSLQDLKQEIICQKWKTIKVSKLDLTMLNQAKADQII